MPKSEPRYDAGYPLAIELVYAQKLGDNTRLFCKWLQRPTFGRFWMVCWSCWWAA